MIFKFFIDSIFNFFGFFVNKLPDADPALSGFLQNGLYATKGLMADWNWIIPVDVMFQLINATILFLISVIFFKFIRWIASILSVNLIH